MSADRFSTPDSADPRPAAGHAASATDESASDSPVWSRMRPWPAIAGGTIALGALVWLIASQPAADVRPVQNGRRFSPSERRQAEEALRSAGIESFRAEDMQLRVPAESVAVADQTLADNDAETDRPIRRWQAASSFLDHFTTARQREQADSAARAQQVARLLEQQPGVAAAEIIWDEESRNARRRSPRVRATVFLTPEPGFTIGLDTVHAVRMAVAGSRAHLDPADVVVMDLQTRTTYEAPQDPDAFARQAQQAELIGSCRRSIEASLAELPGTQVAVRVRDSRATESRPPQQQPAEFPSASPLVGQSGPNLRLAVPSRSDVLSASRSTDSRLDAAVGTDTSIQFDVTVNVPSDAVRDRTRVADAYSGHDVSADAGLMHIQSELRQRIAAAVARALPSRASVNLTVRFDPAMSALAADAPQVGAASWQPPEWLSSLSGSPPQYAIGLFLAMLASVILFVHRRRAVPEEPVQTDSIGSGSEHLTSRASKVAARQPTARPDEFLPGIAVNIWAPIAVREPASVIAGLLRALSPEEVAQLIEQLTPAQQRETLILASTASLTDGELDELRERVRAGVQAAPLPPRNLNHKARQSPESRDAGLGIVPGLSIPSQFDALLDIDDDRLRQLAQRIPAETWAAALTASPPGLVRRLSKISGGEWRRRARQTRPLRLREIESAQRLILDECRLLSSQHDAGIGG